MNLSDYNAMRHNRYKRKCIVHIERENDWFKLGAAFTVLGLDENFKHSFYQTHLNMIHDNFEEYSKLKEIEFKKVIESLELGKGNDNHIMPGYVFQ